jgi:hypothetical protein
MWGSRARTTVVCVQLTERENGDRVHLHATSGSREQNWSGSSARARWKRSGRRAAKMDGLLAG